MKLKGGGCKKGKKSERNVERIHVESQRENEYKKRKKKERD